MPALTRVLLAFASLLLGPLVVMADEFPKDTDKITSLTVEEAKRLMAEFPDCLALNGLTSLSDEAAKALGHHTGTLTLDGLTTLSDKAAKALGKHKGTLHLSGLTTLTDEGAKALAEFKGEYLYIDGLNMLSDEAAETLSANPVIVLPDRFRP